MSIIHNLGLSPEETWSLLSHTPGFVYLIQFSNGIYKIGSTVNLTRRFKQIRAKYGAFDVLHAIPCADCEISERELHQRFRAKRVGIERFALTDDDVAFIRAIKEWRSWAQ